MFLILTPIVTLAEYQKVKHLDAKYLCIEKCFENKKPNALIRMIDISGIPNRDYDIAMHISLDGPDRDKTTDILFEAFSQTGIEINEVNKNQYDYASRQYYTQDKIEIYFIK